MHTSAVGRKTTLKTGTHRVEKYCGSQPELLLWVITPIRIGQKTQTLPVSLSYLGQPLVSVQTASALSGISEEGKALVDPGEEQDKVIRTSRGIHLITMLDTAESWTSHLCKQEV